MTAGPDDSNPLEDSDPGEPSPNRVASDGHLAYHRAMRPIHTAELLSIGSELTVGETRDTNSGELARSLTDLGVEILRMTALPDHLEAVTSAFAGGLERADLVISTGGLGPTPDDLTREALAAAVGEEPALDPQLETWLRGLFARRAIPFPESNLKQAWTMPSATPIPNANGTAPGWWVDRPDGSIIVALPGPPREMRPMWSEWVLPRLHERGLGLATASITLRTSGIGESLIADRLGALLARGTNPVVATYARADAVDIRISAVPTADSTAAALVAHAEVEVRARIGAFVWGHGGDTWPSAIAAALAARDWTLATEERGTRGSFAALIGEGLGDHLARATALPARARRGAGTAQTLHARAASVRHEAGADVGLAVKATERGADLSVSVAIVDPLGNHIERRVAFLGGAMGRTRAALIAASVLHARLTAPASSPQRGQTGRR